MLKRPYALALTGEQSTHGQYTEEGSGYEGGEHHQGAGGHHVLEGCAGGDGNAPLVVRPFGGALVKETRVLRETQCRNDDKGRGVRQKGKIGLPYDFAAT